MTNTTQPATGFVAGIENVVTEVEHFIETLVTDLAPVAAIIEPSLTGWGRLAVDVLNAIAANTTNDLSKANITSTIHSIVANPAIAQDVLKQFGSTLSATKVTEALAVGQVVENVAASLSGQPVAPISQPVKEVQPSTVPLTNPAGGGGDGE
jgi:carbamoylphosphate synthase large subunit